MKILTRAAAGAHAIAAIWLAACASNVAAQVGFVPADTEFMRNMIAHHEQALAMTSLVPARTQREDIGLLALRIHVSQESEMELMRKWLQSRNQPLEDSTAKHHHTSLPGMLSAQDMEGLAATTGAKFERLFLELMIRHHEGALVMLEHLYAQKGAGQGAEIFQIASHIDADQRAEIARMRRLLSTFSDKDQK